MKKIYFVLFAVILFAAGATAQHSVYSDSLVTDFEDLALDPESYWNGDDLSGGFTSGAAYFYNSYNPDFMVWNGWAYSNMSDVSTPGFGNQYSAITGEGFDPGASGGPNYAVSWVQTDFISAEPIPTVIEVTDPEAKEVKGFYVTNSTYAALSMEFGDDFAKKFGGESGDDPDWFMLYTWGYNDGNVTDTVKFYLADYRFEDNEQDYIIKTWEWVDLTSLGEVDSLKFKLGSTDTGAFGINTPTYFCMDNLTFSIESSSLDETSENDLISLFPNPFQNSFIIEHSLTQNAEVVISSIHGQVIFRGSTSTLPTKISLEGQPAGLYIIRINANQSVISRMVLKN
jgi:hypothetical protein